MYRMQWKEWLEGSKRWASFSQAELIVLLRKAIRSLDFQPPIPPPQKRKYRLKRLRNRKVWARRNPETFSPDSAKTPN